MLITDQKELQNYTDTKRLWQGIPAIEVTKRGRIFVAFYSGGTGEAVGNYILLYRSRDGVHFEGPIAVIAPEAGHRCYDPCLWIDPLDRLWLIWADAPANSVRAMICNAPDEEVLCFGEERIIGRDVMMNKPTVLSTGEWLFPIAVWDPALYPIIKQDIDNSSFTGAYAYKTIDQGATFLPFGKAVVPKRGCDEHMILERQDGVLAMYVRTTYGIGVSYSYDRGRTWSRGVDSTLGGPDSRFCIKRLRSGRVILINHVDFNGRNNLTALLSEDDGRTWKYKLLLDGRDQVSYPDLKEADDGYIYIAYDRERGAFKKGLQSVLQDAREILYAKITEEDIIAGACVSEHSRLGAVVNKLGHYDGNEKNPYNEILYLSDSELAEKLLRENDGSRIIDILFDIYPVSCISITNIRYSNIDALIDRWISSGYQNKSILESMIKLMRTVNEEKEPIPIVKRLIEWVDAHFKEEFEVSELAEALHCSVYHMCHEFKKHTGITLLEYRNNKRLTHAKHLLLHTEKRIHTIAAECGYCDESYFGKLFYKAEGVTPSEYRKTTRYS